MATGKGKCGALWGMLSTVEDDNYVEDAQYSITCPVFWKLFSFVDNSQ